MPRARTLRVGVAEIRVSWVRKHTAAPRQTAAICAQPVMDAAMPEGVRIQLVKWRAEGQSRSRGVTWGRAVAGVLAAPAGYARG